MRDVLRFHHEQAAADTCVAACICMVQSSRGELSDEAAFDGAHAGIGLVLTLPATRRLASYDTAEIRVALQTDESVVAIVHGPPYVRWQEAATGQPLAMTEDAFERCFAGQAVAARRGA